MVAALGVRVEVGGRWGVSIEWYRVLVWEDEKVLETDSHDGHMII